jgi:hypothetical protein
MVRLAGAIVVCAAAAFAVAFYATGAGNNLTKRAVVHHKPVAFADPAARSVSFAGAPAALKVPPPPPKPKPKHHKAPAAQASVTPTPAPSTTVTPPARVVTPPKHKASHPGSGHGVTTVG